MAEIDVGLKFRAQADTAAATNGIGGLATAATGLNQALELGKKALALFNAVFVDTAREALAQQEAFVRLSRAVDQTGESYDANADRIGRFISEQQRFTRFADDETIAAMTRIANATAALSPSIGELESLTRLAQDYAEATGADLASATSTIAVAAAGNVRLLAQAIPAYKDAILEIGKLDNASERGAAAVDLLSEAFGGAATNIDPMALALARLHSGFGDVREAIGGILTSSPELATAMKDAADAVDVLAAALDPAADNANGLSQSIRDLATWAVDSFTAIATGMLSLMNTAREAREFVGSFGAPTSEQASLPFEQAFNAAQTSGSYYSRAGGDLDSMLRSSGRADLADRLYEAGQHPVGGLGPSSEAPAADAAYVATLSEVYADISSTLQAGDEAAQRRQRQAEQAQHDLDVVRARLAGARPFNLLQTGTDLFESALPKPEPEDPNATGTGSGPARKDLATVRAQQAIAAKASEYAAFAAMREAAAEAELAMINLVAEAQAAAAEAAKEQAQALYDDKAAKVEAIFALERAQTEQMKQAEQDRLDAGMAAINVMQGGLVDVASGIATAIGTAIGGGELAAANIAKSGLQAIGQTASAVGRMFMLAGIAGTALPMLFPTAAAAIGAGFALQVFGAELGAVAGNIGGGGGSGGGAGSSGGVATVAQPVLGPAQSMTVNDFSGATFIGDDLQTMRGLNRRLDGARALGGTSGSF